MSADRRQAGGARPRPRAITAAGLAALALLLLTGCGITVKETAATGSTPTAPTSGTAGRSPAQSAAARRFAALPKPVKGVVNVAQGAPLGITSNVIGAYEATDPGVSVNGTPTSTGAAFRELCTGQVDIAEATRPMTSAELALCQTNGVSFKTDAQGNPVPIELAADGLVVATKNQEDVGGDCVRLSTLHDMFEPASTVDNWDQLGFDNLPLSVAGSSPSADVFQLFSNLVLGTQGQATLADVRSGYRVGQTDDAVRAMVVGAALSGRVAREERAAQASDLKAAAERLDAAENHAAAVANRKVLAQIATANAARAKSSVALSEAQTTQIVAGNARRDSRAKAAAVAAVRSSFTARLQAQINRRYAARRAAAANPGVAGVFRYTYYELYEEQLRPLEIWDPSSTASQLESEGVDTSQSSAAEHITRTLREQAGGGASDVETVTFPKTPTGAGAKYVAAGEHTVTVPRTGPVDVNTTPNCVFPSRQTITSGVYPLSVRLLAYVPKNRLRRTEVVDYLSYYLAQGQNAVAAERLIPLEDEIREQEYRELTGHTLSQAVLLNGESPAGPVASSTNPASTTSQADGSTASARPNPATLATGVPGVG